MKITRKFTTAGADPFATVSWVKRSSRISNPDGSVVFQMDDVEAPETWSQLATDIMVSKYFRKAGVPQTNATGEPVLDDDGEPVTGPETSARQVIHRLAGCWRFWGESHNYFDSKSDAQAFYDELVYMMVHQMAAPNSPQWFNTGINWAYGINGPAQGHHIADPETGEVSLAKDAYTHPQPHACFIQSVSDDLVNDGGIMDLWVREARLFKYGSGTGTNFSSLRAENEPLSGGGKSSGLMGWLKIGDRAAGAIKSGGTTRRAAKMVCLDLDHPDIETFIGWKVREELKVAALVEGMKHLTLEQRERAESMGLCLDYDFNGEAYHTVSGQNANNSIRIPDSFFDALDADEDWTLRNRTDGQTARTVSANDLWDQIGAAAWSCADPGVQFDSTINAWHTCPAEGRINASNPCSEYMFLDDTACNLASLNLLKFYDAEQRHFDVERYEHAVDVWTIVLEISVLMAAFPSEEIARRSYEYRTLGLGFANIGAMLMQAGVPYDSEEARALCSTLTAILCGRSYRMSALLAGEHGPFGRFKENREHMLRVIRNHRRASRGEPGQTEGQDEYENLHITPTPIDHDVLRSETIGVANAERLLDRALLAWDDALSLGVEHGYRNAQVTVIAPTGTIGLLMDCDTTGVEPDFSLVKFKKLAGGGYFKIANRSLRPALESLGYDDDRVRKILTYVLGTLSLEVPMPTEDGSIPAGQTSTFADWLREFGLKKQDIERIHEVLPGVFDLRQALSVWNLSDDALRALGFDAERAKKDASFDILGALGLSAQQINALGEAVCGAQTIEGAPDLKDEHLPVFDCANKCGQKGKRCITPNGHIRMMAATQPFISGAISKTINLTSDATIDDIKSAYRQSWELGLKANALYRDGCKLSQPLNSKSESAAEESEEQLISEQEDTDAVREALVEITDEAADAAVATANADSERAVRIIERIEHRPMRKRLPDTRRSVTHKFNIADHEGYLTVGLYNDGAPGELFITMAKEGSTIGGLMDSLGTAISVALQYGVPVESLVNKFAHQRFEPAGMTANRDIPFAKSLVDYIFRWIGMEFVPGYREFNAPRREEDTKTPRATIAAPSRETDLTATDTSDRIIEVREISMTSAEIHMAETNIDLKASSSHILSTAMRDCQGDAPACDVCGSITLRSGTCYKCLNCGHSMGCS